ncbi:copper resistance protein CopC/CopD [Antrihabitans sp. YC3-6]|uniref:Copper resistance protein CopC/CopD n=1 Tax=Antrihabitans stalagmiti TaxID=2799499 RepID=A0A934NT54_9NOCA|nr:copper resistance protein CopC [Antrihabitans stalagmiti]MBJ8340838.1 copper resistance protein CopC/CopD [Antrihabitans stalagmiti]
MIAAVRGVIRGCTLLLVLAGLAIGTAGPVNAHPTLLFTEPGSDSAVPDSPESITVLFNEAVTAGPAALVVFDINGDEVPMGTTVTLRDGRFVTASPTGTLNPGTYTVRWRVTGADGDLLEQDFRFAVGIALTGDRAQPDNSATSWRDAVLRWLLFTGVAVSLGGLLAARFTSSARAENSALPTVRSWTVAGALIGLAGVAGLAFALVVYAGTVAALWQGRSGLVLIVEAIGFVLAITLTSIRGRTWPAAALLIVVAAEGVRSHANLAAPGWGAVLTGIHLAAAAIWVGALLHTVRAVVAWRHQRAAVRWVLAGYIALAMWTFVVVITTGAVTALLLIPIADVVTTSYGRVLLIKLGLVAVASGLAFVARLALRSGQRTDKAPTVLRAENIVLVVVLAASAVRVSTPPPVGGSAQESAPPPSSIGVVLPLATLAGQVGVSVAASEEQLVVRLSTPRRGDYYAPDPDQHYGLAARLDGEQRVGAELSFRQCGRGCFVAPADWHDGTNILTLRVEADGWHGATVSLPVPWPVEPVGDDLARAVAATRASGDLTVYETVTSDATAAARDPEQLDIPAAFFLAQEPYADGTAPLAVRLPNDARPVRLALGYPAAGMNVLLTLDESGRISEEIFTDAKHLVTRRFVYP